MILIDALAVLYRAYFAIRDLSTSSGRPTNAVFGFIRMLKHLKNEWNPTHWAVVFDGGLSEEKVTLLEEYKAQRPPMPDPLCEQIQTAEEYLDKSCISWVRQNNQEADDVLASVSAWAETETVEILIATSDKDMFQLVNEKVSVIPVSGKNTAMGPKEIQCRTGVSPLQIVDWLALAGDNSDNIPGVPGIGPKTAAKLLGRYGSVSALFEHVEDVSREKLKTSLKQNRDMVLRNVELVRLRRDLFCPFTWDELEVRPADPERLLPFFEELEFNAMAREMREGSLFES